MTEILNDSSGLIPAAAIGALPWSREAMIAELEAFAELYARRPISDNRGGMSSAHMFNFWFALKSLRPTTVIESGVFQGQGSWLIEQTVPHARLICIDINWSRLKYRSDRATYLDTDFATHDWSALDKESTLCFFDDHMNAFERLMLCARLGFRHLVFEDNYFPADEGDLYTLKQALAGVGYRPHRSLRYWASRLKGTRHDVGVAPNVDDAAAIRSVVDVYQELPPVFLPAVSRWGKPMTDYPSTAPLLTRITEPRQQVYADEAAWYTWIAYVRLKP